MFIAALFTIAKTWRQSRYPSTDEWIKMWYTYAMEYYPSIKRRKKLSAPVTDKCKNVPLLKIVCKPDAFHYK